MPEIQEQIHDYRCPAPPVLLSPLPPRPFSFPCGVCASLVMCVCVPHSLSSNDVHVFLCVSLWLRTKRTLGLGSLYGENDLLDLDGDPLHERQVAEKQLAALGDIL